MIRKLLLMGFYLKAEILFCFFFIDNTNADGRLDPRWHVLTYVLLDLLSSAFVVNSLGAMHGGFFKYVKCHFCVFQA